MSDHYMCTHPKLVLTDPAGLYKCTVCGKTFTIASAQTPYDNTPDWLLERYFPNALKKKRKLKEGFWQRVVKPKESKRDE